MLVVLPKSELCSRDVSNVCGSFHGSLIFKIFNKLIQANLGFLIFFFQQWVLNNKGKNYEIIEKYQCSVLLRGKTLLFIIKFATQISLFFYYKSVILDVLFRQNKI